MRKDTVSNFFLKFDALARRKKMRHKLSKAEQIRGIQKALKNKRTPKQFLPGMRKRLAKLKA